MRKIIAVAAAAGAYLMIGAGTAMAEIPTADWTAYSKYASVSASGVYEDYKHPDYDTFMRRASGKLIVTDRDPKACYFFQVSMRPIYAKPPRWVQGSQSAKQCGPGTLTTSSTVGSVGAWDFSVRICKNGECS